MLVALVLSLTLTPVLANRFLNPGGKEDSEGEVKFVKWIKRGYTQLLEYALGHKRVVIGIALGLSYSYAFGLLAVGKDFMPKLDEGSWFISTITPLRLHWRKNNRITLQIEEILAKNPNISEVIRRNRPLGKGHRVRASRSTRARCL